MNRNQFFNLLYDEIIKSIDLIKQNNINGLLDLIIKYSGGKFYRYRHEQWTDEIKRSYVYLMRPQQTDDLLEFTYNYDIDISKKVIFSSIKNHYIKIFSKQNKYLGLNNNYCTDIFDSFTKEGQLQKEKFYKLINGKTELKSKADNLYNILKSIEDDANDLFKNDLPKYINAIEQNLSQIRNDYLMCCFVNDKNSNSMWSKYANKYQGFCIEYDLSKLKMLEPSQKRGFINILPILYGNKTRMPYYKDFFLNELNGDENIFLDDNEFKKEIIKQTFTKDSTWSNQNEWRLLAEDIGIRELYIPAISAIYIGCRASQQTITEINKICSGKSIIVFNHKLEKGGHFSYKRI